MELKEAMLKVSTAALKSEVSEELIEAIVVLGMGVNDAIEFYELQDKAPELSDKLASRMTDKNGGTDA